MKKTIFTLMVAMCMFITVSCDNKTSNDTVTDTCTTDTTVTVVDSIMTDTCTVVNNDTIAL